MTPLHTPRLGGVHVGGPPARRRMTPLHPGMVVCVWEGHQRGAERPHYIPAGGVRVGGPPARRRMTPLHPGVVVCVLEGHQRGGE